MDRSTRPRLEGSGFSVSRGRPGLCLYICPAHGTVPPRRGGGRGGGWRRTEISNIRTAKREAGRPDVYRTDCRERARRAFSMVSLQKCHAQSRAATRRDAPSRAAPRPARSRTVVVVVVVDLSTMRSRSLFSLSRFLVSPRPVVVTARRRGEEKPSRRLSS